MGWGRLISFAHTFVVDVQPLKSYGQRPAQLLPVAHHLRTLLPTTLASIGDPLFFVWLGTDIR